ncbi:MAG TPA: hypothetical protein VLL54_05385 [Pyrinomonadaceae bacterium]|nr:hypothetical protein [Pyrinomonadaceae bacterium]
MKPTTKLKNGFAILVAVAGVTLSGATLQANGQGKSDPKVASSRSNQSGRDPFKKYEPPQIVIKKSATLALVPSIQQRIEDYKLQKLAAMNARVAAPKPTTAFLLSEVQVVGISRTPRGYAAIVEATPIKLAYVIYPGERFYDGQLVAIEDNRLVFRRETVYSDGKRDRVIELKPLRQASTVDALSAAATSQATGNATGAGSPNASQPESEKKSEKPAAEKP